MKRLEDVRRATARDWPLFSAVDADFDILSASVARADGEFENEVSRRRCAALLRNSLHTLDPGGHLVIETLVRVRRGGRTASSRLLARRAGLWQTLESPIGLPAGERTETAVDTSEGVDYLGRIRATIDQLDECLELSRGLNAGTFIPLSADADPLELEASFRKSTTGTDTGYPNRSWAILAPAALQAGYCALRTTGWFDDRESGIDIFGQAVFLDRLEEPLRVALAA